MSQQEKLLALFKEMKLPFEVRQAPAGPVVHLEVKGGQPVLRGYTGMVCQFKFDKEGAFTDALIAE